MIKLITFTTSGHAYLNFMGNEFGHPNRVEFPMSSNNYSFMFANRQWELLMDKGIHSNLFNFDMVISYTRGSFLFVFNFHPETSCESYRVGVEEAGDYQIILNTDDTRYGGHGELESHKHLWRTNKKRADGYQNSLEVALPRRSAQVYKLMRILRI
ncbi:1,4-alpha-glucan-branching enzyme 3, chloroplastic/amyloplastic-like isoform X3 [Ananas comosus]|uniref:1,4-alpha-glucan-branching enzyme 3, chloroplastic/amyloplastic-like isoform X3 n=1 Tax=Ananas comosus TaxID=4615 RepID=A0A6P5ECS2_ANACO|nr:1,4-alpha-glucan-branching enzyme 3, chloroplastic/amyloplastic-like isoform X3 [Ananas comosus]